MKLSTTKCLILLGFTWLWSFLLALSAEAQLPSILVNHLNQREQRLLHSTFTWVVEDQTIIYPLPARIAEAIHSKEINYLRTQKAPEQVIQKSEQNARLERKPRQSHSRSTWRFTYDNPRMLVSGTVVGLPPESVVMGFQQFYQDKNGLQVNDYATTGRKEQIMPLPSRIWHCSGESTRFRSPLIMGLNVTPEDLVMLTARDPLAMYDAQWELVQTTPAFWIVQTKVKAGNQAPFTVQMTLSRDHDGAPAKITLTAASWQSVYSVQRFVINNHSWIASEVTSSFTSKKEATQKRVWRLKNLVASKPFITSGLARNVLDLRLVGTNLTTPQMAHAFMNNDPNIVTYKWTGEFLSEQQLKSMQSGTNGFTQEPPARNLWTWLPGLLLVVGGVLWNRRWQRKL